MVLISLLSDVTDPAGYGHFLLRPVSASDLKLQKPDPIPDGSQLEKNSARIITQIRPDADPFNWDPSVLFFFGNKTSIV